MPKNTPATRALPPRAREALVALGADLRFARKRRGWSLREAAKRAFITVTTLRRLESGHPGVSLGVLAQVLALYGMVDPLGALAEPGADRRALSLERRRLEGGGSDFDV